MALLVLGLAASPALVAKGSSGGSHAGKPSAGNPAHSYSQAPGGHSTSGKHKSTYAQGAPRDSHGKIARSKEAKAEFKKQHPCPSTGKSSGSCPGYVIDHRQALKHGGKDEPSNMQWQTNAEGKAKDKWE